MSLLALIVGLAVQGTAPTAPQPIDPTSWFKAEDYPVEALRSNAEGTVAYQLEVDATGAPERCQVMTSSGNDALDRVTCAILKQKARFKPAVDAQGRPTAANYSSRTTWKMPGAGGATEGIVYHATIIDLAEDGRLECRIEARVIPRDEQPSCDRAREQVQTQPGIEQEFERIVFLIVSHGTDKPSFTPPSSWGERIGRLVSEQAYLGGSYPVTCTTLSAEGVSAGADACAGFPNRGRQLTAAEKEKATISRLETSIYALARN